MHYDYWFTYEEDHEIETILLRDILSVKVLNLKSKKDGTCNPVLFKYTHTFGTNSNSNFLLKKLLNEVRIILHMGELYAFRCVLHCLSISAHAKILKPQSYIDSFVERLDEIKGIYK